MASHQTIYSDPITKSQDGNILQDQSMEVEPNEIQKKVTVAQFIDLLEKSADPNHQKLAEHFLHIIDSAENSHKPELANKKFNEASAGAYFLAARYINPNPKTNEHNLIKFMMDNGADEIVINRLLSADLLEAELRKTHKLIMPDDKAAQKAQSEVYEKLTTGASIKYSLDQILHMGNYLLLSKEKDPLNTYKPEPSHEQGIQHQ